MGGAGITVRCIHKNKGLTSTTSESRTVTMNQKATTNPNRARQAFRSSFRPVSNDAMTRADYYRYVEKTGRTPGDTLSAVGEALARHGDLT